MNACRYDRTQLLAAGPATRTTLGEAVARKLAEKFELKNEPRADMADGLMGEATAGMTLVLSEESRL